MTKIKMLICASCAIFFLNNCQSVKPKSVVEVLPAIEYYHDTQPSWDGDEQNSGIIDYIDGEGFLITAKAATRYTELGKLYGKILIPELKPGEGLIKKENNFILPSEYITKWAVMNRKHKRNEND